jgi:APA family basic amino acid/polyamine antiporter
MFMKRLFATKSLEMLHKEMNEDEGRLRRVLGPIGLTSLGIGAIIGAGIFVMTGRVAAQDAGPAIVVSYVVAGIGCALAAFCYAEFASMAPVAGSAYTYAYATLGELLAWIIGWDLILEYAMSCATVAASWSKYFNEFLRVCFGPNWVVPSQWCHDRFTQADAYMNLPAVCILALVTIVLVIGIRESAAFNTVMVLIKLGVVLFVIAIGIGYVNKANWTEIPVEARRQPQETAIVGVGAFAGVAEDYVKKDEKMPAGPARDDRIEQLKAEALASFRLSRIPIVREATQKQGHLTPERAKHLDALAEDYTKRLPNTEADKIAVQKIIADADAKAPEAAAQKWGILRYLGLNTMLVSIDDSVRSNFFPYGFSGMMLGASLVFFAFIGFDSISTHAEEAIKPQRDVPFGILASLFVCTILYIAVSSIITGMVPYPEIDEDAAVASAFRQLSDAEGGNSMLRASAGLIAAGGLAGMTSVLLITFLSQARIFLAMARDRLLPPSVFGAVHPKFKTPHISTMLTGAVIMIVAAFTPIGVLEEMVNIGTLLAFVIVCGAVLLLRMRRPDATRPFRCPALFLVAPLGIVVNVIMMLFLPKETWFRLLIWLAIGLVIYFGYGYSRSSLGKRLEGRQA